MGGNGRREDDGGDQGTQRTSEEADLGHDWRSGRIAEGLDWKVVSATFFRSGQRENRVDREIVAGYL
jgi:hypothetical protein